jgi:predicted phosphodiesterase
MLSKAYKIGSNLIPLTPTPQCFHEVEVTYHNLSLKRPFELSFLGDEHYASQECHEDFLKYAHDRAETPPKLPKKNSAVIEMGDAYEANTKESPEDSLFNQKYTNEESKDKTIERKKSIAKKMWVWQEANHDGERSRKLTGTANSRDICQVLDVPYSKISTYNVIDFNGHRLIIYTNHGKNRSTPKWVGTKRKTWEESMNYSDADIIAIGHIHRLKYEDIIPNENITENVVIDYENQCMVTQPAEFKKRLITGHFLGYLGGYGQRKAYPVNPSGYPILVLNPDGTYDVKEIWYRDFAEGIL